MDRVLSEHVGNGLKARGSKFPGDDDDFFSSERPKKGSQLAMIRSGF